MNLSLIKYIGIGGSLAFAAAVQPGPLQAYLLNRVASIGWRRTLPASFSPLLSDGPIALLALLILGRLSPSMQAGLRMAGGILLLCLAWRAYRQWRIGVSEELKQNEKVPRTFFEAAVVNLLNPHPYLGWSLIMGPVVITAWRDSPALGIAVVGAFYVTMVAMLAVLIFLFSSASLLKPKHRRFLILLSAAILAGLALYQLAAGVRHFNG